jgi:hypothetical protein
MTRSASGVSRGLEEPFEPAAGLWATDLAEGVLDLTVREVRLGGTVSFAVLVACVRVERRAVVGAHFEKLAVSRRRRTNAVEALDGRSGEATVFREQAMDRP